MAQEDVQLDPAMLRAVFAERASTDSPFTDYPFSRLEDLATEVLGVEDLNGWSYDQMVDWLRDYLKAEVDRLSRASD